MTNILNKIAVSAVFLGFTALPAAVMAEESTGYSRPAPPPSARYHAAAKRRHRRAVRKTVKRVGVGAAGGAVAGAVIGGGPGAAVGAVAGAGAGAIYDHHEKDKGR